MPVRTYDVVLPPTFEQLEQAIVNREIGHTAINLTVIERPSSELDARRIARHPEKTSMQMLFIPDIRNDQFVVGSVETDDPLGLSGNGRIMRAPSDLKAGDAKLMLTVVEHESQH